MPFFGSWLNLNISPTYLYDNRFCGHPCDNLNHFHFRSHLSPVNTCMMQTFRRRHENVLRREKKPPEQITRYTVCHYINRFHSLNSVVFSETVQNLQDMFYYGLYPINQQYVDISSLNLMIRYKKDPLMYAKKNPCLNRNIRLIPRRK